MQTTSISLLERVRQPDETQAWKRFVELYTPALVAWARHFNASEVDTADLIQEVFVLLLRKLPEFRYEPGKSFRAWLRTLLVHKWYEIQRRRSPAAADTWLLEQQTARPPDEPFWESEFRQHVVARALEIMKSEFEPTTWRACWLTVFEERPAADVARELGMSVNAVYLARSRVLRRLNIELAGMLD